MDEKELRLLWRSAWCGIGFCTGVFAIVWHWIATGSVPSESMAQIVLLGFTITGAAFPLVGIDAKPEQTFVEDET